MIGPKQMDSEKKTWVIAEYQTFFLSKCCLISWIEMIKNCYILTIGFNSWLNWGVNK